MRDILNLLDALNEATNLAPSELKDPNRFEKFLWKIENGDPFLNKNREQVFLDPAEAERFRQLRAENLFAGALVASVKGGGQIALSQLLKTNDLGGQQGDPHKPGEADAGGASAGKESLLVKPKTIQITDIDIPAKDLYKVISSNQILNSTDYGKTVIQLANAIVAGKAVVLPPEYQDKSMEKIRKAIVDYAGEYLGVLALVTGRTKFDNQAGFTKWLGAGVGELVINFPGKSNTNIADSYATVKNKKTSHSLNISSKGTGGGAAPAISGLKISDDIKKNPKLKNAVKFIELCQAKADERGASTLIQAFEAMNFIYSINPGAISKKFQKFLPWQPNDVATIVDAVSTGRPLPKKYASAFSDIKTRGGKANEGGTLVYAIKKDVAEAINDRNAIPEFKDTILQVLEMNFIQQYTDYSGGEMTFETQWPAKLDGDVSVVNKSSAAEPTAGGFSFKLGRVTKDDEVGGSDYSVSTDRPNSSATTSDELDTVAQKRSKVTARAGGVDQTKKLGSEKTLGRKRQR
jgi:hypothetical protein